MSNSLLVCGRLMRLPAWPWLLTLALSMPLAAAPNAASPKAADPLDAKAAVPPAVHRSAIASTRRATEPSVGSWREANEAVNRIGGWRAYAREPLPGDAAASAPARQPEARP
jgi:hypothetical protein